MRPFNSDTSLGRKSLWVTLPLTIIPLVVFGLLSYNISRQALLEQVDRQLEALMSDLSVLVRSTSLVAQESLISELSTFRYVFNSRGMPEVVDGQMVLRNQSGDYVVNGNYELVDQILEMSGSRATVFQKMGDQAVRISTNVQTLDGDRAIGTIVSDPVYDAVVNRGETYLGVADVVGTIYLTAYEKILDSRGSIIGILFVGITESALYEAMLPAVAAMNFGENGHIHVLDETGNSIVESDIPWDPTLYGPDVLQRILKTRDAAAETPQSIVDTGGNRDRVNWYTYIPELDWLIVAHVYPDEFLTPLERVRSFLVYFLAILVGVAVLVSLFIGSAVSRNAGRFISVTRQLETGKLESAEQDIDQLAQPGRKRDELALVANAFKNAIHALRERDAQLVANEERLTNLVEQLQAQDEQMQIYFDNAIAGMAITSPDKGWVRVNQALSDFLGYSIEELKNLTWAEITHPDDLAKDQGEFERTVSGEIDNYQMEKRFIRKDGEVIPALIAVSVVRNEDGTPDFFIAQVIDLIDLKNQEQEIVLARDKLEAIAASTNAGIVSIANDGQITYLSPRFSELFDYEIGDLKDSNAWAKLAGVNRLSKNTLARIFAHGVDHELMQEHLPNNVEIAVRTGNGRIRNVLLSAKQTMDNLVVTFNDISEQKRREMNIQYAAQHDTLTGLPNRSLLSERLDWHVKQARRSRWLICVAFLDLDGFKVINDTHGHKAGDLVLKETANRLLAAVREVDTVARLGGDEFAIVLTELESRDESLPLFQRILDAVRAPVRHGKDNLSVSASIGVSFFAQDEVTDGDLLLRQADKAMYDAKLAGKNRYAIFDAEVDRSMQDTQRQLNEIARAIAAEEFALYYQPKVSLGTGEVIGAEALLRWESSATSTLEPDQFLPRIYDHSLAEELGAWVLQKALDDLDELITSGRSLPVSINVFPRQFVAQEFAPTLQRLLDQHSRIEPEFVELEIVETAALNDLEGARRVMLTCQDLGVRCALDDFGTGFSSLSHLKYLPASTLKIDRSFISDLLQNPDDLAIVEGTLSLAGAFGHQVIAEGVETIDQGVRLIELGCELGQGYAIARPMPLSELLVWLDTWEVPQEWAQAAAESARSTRIA